MTNSRVPSEHCLADRVTVWPRLSPIAAVGLAGCVVAVLVVSGSGCGPRKASSPSRSAKQLNELRQERDHFGAAMELLSNLAEYEPISARQRILADLNQWVEEIGPGQRWDQDPLIQRLPRAYRDLEALRNLSKLEFTSWDVFYLQEAAWLRDVAQWASQPTRNSGFTYVIERAAASLDAGERETLRRADDPLASALRTLDQSLDAESADKLAVSLRLFDWTIRNTQLEALRPRTTQEVVGPRLESETRDSSAATTDQLHALTQPGPGYQRFPWQVLMYGRADAWERARLFVHLARQLQIDVLMLGLDETARTSRATPWLPAVFLRGQLYLLDTALGLPIPGTNNKAVATLDELMKNRDVLRALDTSGGGGPALNYPVRSDQLDHVVALIDAPAESLSRRMRAVEDHLAGQYKMVLTTNPSVLVKSVSQCAGINRVGLWTIPFDTFVYRTAVLDKVRRGDPNVLNQFVRTEGIYEGTHPLVKARWTYFQGLLKAIAPGQEDAKSLYLKARLSNEFIDQLATDQPLQNALGLARREDEDDLQWQAKIAQMQVAQRLIRIHAGYFLALAHFESGDFGDAVNWFQRTRQADEDEIWEAGIQYNLGRSYEAMGNWSAAEQFYLEDTSPQRHGNRLRVQLAQPGDA